MTSALPPKADSSRTSRYVRKVPTRDSCTAAILTAYSIISSARASNVGGMMRPNAEHELGKSPAVTVYFPFLGGGGWRPGSIGMGGQRVVGVKPLLCTFHRAFFSIGSRTTVRRSITPAHLGRKA